MSIIKLSRNIKKTVIIFLDIICIILSIILSFSLRLETIYSPIEINIYVYLIFIFLIIGFNLIFGVYEVISRYFHLLNILNLFKSILVSGLILIIFNLMVYQNIYFPRSISFIAIVLIFLLMVIFRVLISFILNFSISDKKNALLVGLSKNSINIINLSGEI